MYLVTHPELVSHRLLLVKEVRFRTDVGGVVGYRLRHTKLSVLYTSSTIPNPFCKFLFITSVRYTEYGH